VSHAVHYRSTWILLHHRVPKPGAVVNSRPVRGVHGVRRDVGRRPSAARDMASPLTLVLRTARTVVNGYRLRGLGRLLACRCRALETEPEAVVHTFGFTSPRRLRSCLMTSSTEWGDSRWRRSCGGSRPWSRVGLLPAWMTSSTRQGCCSRGRMSRWQTSPATGCSGSSRCGEALQPAWWTAVGHRRRPDPLLHRLV